MTLRSVLVLAELRVAVGQGMAAHQLAQNAVPILKLDTGYAPVPVAPSPDQAGASGGVGRRSGGRAR
jgi:hypothetical protein